MEKGIQTYSGNLAHHKAYAQVFRPGKLSFGLIAPMRGYANSPFPDMSNHLEIVRKADAVGIDAMWLRDVPFYDPNFGDAGQLYDPMVYAGWLAAQTARITIGTAGIVLPLRDPAILAKQVLSVDKLTGGRFILGLAGGDRYTEYPAMGVSFDSRVARFRDATQILKKLMLESFPKYESQFYGNLTGNLDMHPKPIQQVPMLNIGRAGQDIDWIAEQTDGWIWHGLQAQRADNVIAAWREATGEVFKPYGYGNFFELSKDPDMPVQASSNFMYGGRNRLIAYWKEQEAQGINHIVLNLKPSQRNPLEVLEEFGTYIVPAFK